MELKKIISDEYFVIFLIVCISIITGIILSGHFTILGIWNLFFLLLYSIYNIFKIKELQNKKIYLRKILYMIIQFIIIHSLLSLIIAFYVWNIRDVKLIEITKLEYTFSYVFFNMIFMLCIISFIIVQVINLKSFLKINKHIYLRLLPLKISLFLVFLSFSIVIFHIEGICVWDLLQDTKYSKDFNVYNIDKIKIGMEKEKVVELIGDSYFHTSNRNVVDRQYWTSDGKSKIGDFAWLQVEIIFENNIVYSIEIKWVYD
jgi:hypothetical protein